MATLVDQLEKLNDLHSKGILTQEEFDASKKATIQQYSLPPVALWLSAFNHKISVIVVFFFRRKTFKNVNQLLLRQR